MLWQGEIFFIKTGNANKANLLDYSHHFACFMNIKLVSSFEGHSELVNLTLIRLKEKVKFDLDLRVILELH